jgi:hypothetical protein
LSDFSVISLRRLAWAMGTTMGAAFVRIVRLMPPMVDPALVCQRCTLPGNGKSNGGNRQSAKLVNNRHYKDGGFRGAGTAEK